MLLAICNWQLAKNCSSYLEWMLIEAFFAIGQPPADLITVNTFLLSASRVITHTFSFLPDESLPLYC